ncbi:MAG: anti-anti-sigma factor [Glaciecola sp.]|jgi:anti-anti-sigma factor
MIERVIRIPERFDFGYHKEFTEHQNEILADPNVTQITLEFSRVSYLDSSALGMMILLQKKARNQNVSVRIRGPKESTKEILQIANFDQLFDIS